MRLRGYREEDRGVVARLAAHALGGSVEGWEEHYTPEKNPHLDTKQVYLIEEDGDVRAMAAVLPLEVYVDGEPVPMGGVAEVATHAAYRRRGYAGELMRAAITGMRERGIHLSMLHPFAHPFYRRYGWELATEAISYGLKPTDLPTAPEQENVRAYKDDDLSAMMHLLDREASGYQLCVRRGEQYWRRLLAGAGQEAAVYEEDGNVGGYLLYELGEGGATPRTLKIREVVAASPAARGALVSFAAAFDPLMFGIEYATPRGEPLHPYLPSAYVQARISPEFMLRLVDVEGALGLLHRRAEALETPLVLEVSDDRVPENAGSYTLGGTDGVVRGVHAAERVEIDVRGLAQLYAGYLPARQLARRGLVRPGSEGALGLLEALFPVAEPWVSPPDHF